MSAINGHVHLGDSRPRGWKPVAEFPTFVVTTHRTRRTKVHRPTYVIANPDEGIAARFLCNSASASVEMHGEPPKGVDPCVSCEEHHYDPQPEGVCVYAYLNAEGQYLYIGQSANIPFRERTHRAGSPWWPEVAKRRTLSNHTFRPDALRAEAEAIRTRRPLYNVRHNPGRAA